MTTCDNKGIGKMLRERLAREKAPLCKPGRHRLKVSGILGGKSKDVSCTRCRFRCEVPLTSTERRMWAARQKAGTADIKDIHGLGWAYQKEFYKYEPWRLTDEQYVQHKRSVALMNKHMRGSMKPRKAKRVHQNHVGFKWGGWELMMRLEKFAGRHKEVVILQCDDHYHASSTICLIPHVSKKEFWGTTVVIAPQMGIFPATEFFLYPDEADALAKALGAGFREHRAKERAAGYKEWKYGGWWPDTSIPAGFKADGL